MALNVDSCDTLGDIDMNFKDMRTCDGPCQEILFNDQLEIFSCCHAICGECLNELTDIEISNGKYLCPVSTCRHGNALRNASSVNEYTYLKRNLLRLYPTKALTYSKFKQPIATTPDDETSLSIVHLIPSQSSPNITDSSTSAMSNYENDTEKSMEYISGTTIKYSNMNEPCTSWISTSPDFYSKDETFSGPITNPFYAVTISDCSTAQYIKYSPLPMNASDYEESLIEELQALSCATADAAFYEDDFDDCKTAICSIVPFNI